MENGPNKCTPEATRSSCSISDKVDFKLNSTRNNNEGHFLLMKRTTHQGEILIHNIYASNIRAPIYIKKL
jgi:hypothetical protein